MDLSQPCRLLRGAALLTLSLAALLGAHAAELISGPMLGGVTRREAIVWLEARGASEAVVEYWIQGKPETLRRERIQSPALTPAGTQVLKFKLPLLSPGTVYEYAPYLDGARVERPYPLTFRTDVIWEWRTPAPDISFAFGSCAYINDTPFDRPGKPYGKGTEIFKHIASSGADFMLWDGDCVYLREGDYESESGIWYRWSHDRATPDLQPLLAAMPHYAMWDDHDYGPNDSNRSYPLKHYTREAFLSYWGNPSAGEDGQGIYTRFYRSDAAFILADNRWFRDDTRIDEDKVPHKTQWGARQLDWIKQSLMEAKIARLYTFKFIITGGQVLSSTGKEKSETFEHFRRERDELLAFIRDQQIPGVIFLTGDVHFTELLKYQPPGAPLLYELTSSPLSAGSWKVMESGRAGETRRVPGTMVDTQNFCLVKLHGPKEDRKVTITCIDRDKVKRWEHTISASELK